MYDSRSAFPGGFMNLTDFRGPGLAFCRVSLHWGLSAVFLVVRLGWGVLGRRSTEVKRPCHHLWGGDWDRSVTACLSATTVPLPCLVWVGGDLSPPSARGPVCCALWAS